MGSVAAAVTSSMVRESFEELERQRELITSCTLLWKELSDHFSSLERGLEARSESLRSMRQSLDLKTQRTLDSLRRREASIAGVVDLALAKLDERREAVLQALSSPASGAGEGGDDLPQKLRSLCTMMDSDGFWQLLVSKKKEVELFRLEIPLALADCIDPARFVMDAICGVFPVDKREEKSPNDLGWACVLVLESLVLVLADPEFGSARPLVPRSIREKAKEMADAWKEALEQRGGVESTKPPDAHAFLQLVVTFGIVEKEDKGLYRRLVVSFSWRRQMPKLALSLGLEEEIDGIIEELVVKGQQLDAVNFAYEAGLQDKFPPVPLLKSFLEDSKASPCTSENQNSTNQAGNNVSRKEQSAIRAVIKCIEERKLEAEFPIESLETRLENLEKYKTEKKKPAPGGGGGGGPANKRSRTNNGGPMPPAKAGRLTNNAYILSFPAPATFVRSPSHTSYLAAAVPPYPHDRPMPVYSSRSPPAMRDPYAYPTEEVANPGLGMAYPAPPMNYPAYGGYANGPAFHQVYYR